MRSACFKLKFKRLVFKWKRCVSKPGVWLVWGVAGETNKLWEKRFVSGPEINVSKPWERLVSGSGNNVFEPEKFVFRPESNVSETGQEN
jgi:hypothetical protein